jgi:hypothetical protein
MPHKQRFIVIAWPEDHDEGDLADVACDIQDLLDMAQAGGAKVIAPIPDALHEACTEHLKDVF